MKQTKRSLLMSALSLLLCFSMLLGTSWAWFTDSVSSGSNVIKSGNLDLDVQYTLDGKTWNDLDGADDLFQKGLWEPGHTEVVALKITNKGSLALKYSASMNIIKETIGKNKDGGNIVLSEILTVSTLTFAEAGVDPLFGFNIAERSIEEAFKGENNLAYNAPVAFKAGNVLQDDKQLLPGEAHYVVVKVDMPETVGNEANHDGKNAPKIEFGINVLATQSTYESDSFGDSYDKDATFEDFANTNILAKETKTLVAGERSIEFDLSNEGLKIASVSVPADAILDPTKPVTVTFDGIERQITGENIEGYAYDIKVTNLKSGLTGDQLVTVVVEAPKALAAMQAYHNGVLIEDAVYDEVAGTVTFKTASFSPFDFTSNVEDVETLDELRTALQKDDTTAKLMADIEVDLTKGSGAARVDAHAYVGANNTYYNGVMINGKNVGLDLNGHSITAFCGDQYNSNSDVGALFFVGKEGSLNIIDRAGNGFIKMRSSIYAVWAPFADPSYVDIYGGAFIADYYAGDPVGTPLGSDGKYDRENGTMSITQENSNRSIIYAGYGGNINVYGGYFLYNNTINDKSNRNNGAFNAKDYYEAGALITIHDGVYLSNKEYRQNPYRNPETNPSFDDYSIKLAKYCEVVQTTDKTAVDGITPPNGWYRVTLMQPVSLTVEGLKESYAVGDTLNLIVTANYSGGITKILDASDYTIEGADLSTIGAKVITITYTECDKTVETALQTKAVGITGIYAEASIDRFELGKNVSDNNFKVYATANDGSIAEVSDFSVSGLNSNVAGTQQAIVTFGGYTTTCKITFVDVPKIDTSKNIKVKFWNGNVAVFGNSLTSQVTFPRGDNAATALLGSFGESATRVKVNGKYYDGNLSNNIMGTPVMLNDAKGYIDISVTNASPNTWLGHVSNIGFEKKIVDAGYYFDNDMLSYESCTVSGGFVHQLWESEAVAQQYGYWVQIYAATRLDDFELNDTKSHTVKWVVKFEDGTSVVIGEWAFKMAELSGDMYEETDKPNANVIILAGQSNATGHAPLTDAIKNSAANYDFSNIYIHYKTSDGTDFNHAKQSNIGFDQYVPGMSGWVNPDATDAKYFGPELGLAEYIAASGLNGERWYIIKYSVCGSGLAANWLANQNYATDMLNFVDDAISDLSKTYDVKVAGFMWMQGETDAMNSTWANQYAQNEQTLVSMVRNKFAKYATRVGNEPGSGITFINMQIATKEYGPNWTFAETVNKAKYNNCSNWVSGYYGQSGSLTPGAGWGTNASGAITNAIYVETVGYNYKHMATNEHSQYTVIGDTGDDCHYCAEAMRGIGADKFGIAFEYMYNLYK